MPTTFFNISLALKEPDIGPKLPLEELQRRIRDSIEELYAGEGFVFSVTWDRDMALAEAKANQGPHEVITHGRKPEAIDEDVAQVCERYNWTLRKPRKGGPPWRVVDHIGEVEGLSHLRGKVVLTDGILAMMVLPNNRWMEIHWKHFIADSPEELEDDLKPKAKVPTKLERFFSFKSEEEVVETT